MDIRRTLSIRIIAFAAFSALCYFGAGVIITLFMAILTAYMLDPFVSILMRIRVPRSLAISFTIIAAVFIFAVILFVFIDRVQDFSTNFAQYSTRVQKITKSLRGRMYALEKKSEDISKTILPKTTQEPQPVQIKEYSSAWERFFFRDLGPIYEKLFLISFYPFLVYFLLQEKTEVQKLVVQYIRSRTSLSRTMAIDTSDKIVRDLNAKIQGFIFGFLLSAIILFLVSWLIFFSFSVEESFIWALIFTLLGVLPFVGAILSLLPPILISITQFSSLQMGIIFVSVCLMLHIIYANWLIPKTTGKRTDLSPLVVLVAMMYWGVLWGAIGIFLAIPITASLRTIYLQYRALETGSSEEP